MNRTDTRACAHDDDLIARAALGLLAPQEELALARRSAECPTCCARLDEYRALAAAVAALDSHPVPISCTTIPQHAQGDARSPSDLGGGGVMPGIPARLPRGSSGSTRRRYEGWYVAAAVVLIVGMAAFIFNTLAGAHLATGPYATATHVASVPPTPTATIPLTPGATPGAQGKYFVNVETAQNVDRNNVPTNVTSRFTVGDAVYVVFRVQGLTSNQQHTVSIRWFLQGLSLGSFGNSNTSVSVKGDQQVYFSLYFPVSGLGMARLLLDAPANDTGSNPLDPYLGATIYFGVFAATPGPAPAGTLIRPGPPELPEPPLGGSAYCKRIGSDRPGIEQEC